MKGEALTDIPVLASPQDSPMMPPPVLQTHAGFLSLVTHRMSEVQNIKP